jgi:hypothetical protein
VRPNLRSVVQGTTILAVLLLPGCSMILDPFTRVDHYRWEGKWVRDPAGLYVQCGPEMCFDDQDWRSW